MKRALPLLMVMIALGAVVFFTARRTGGGGGGAAFSVQRAAELAPAEATFFLAIPELERVMARWQERGIYAMVPDPEWVSSSWQDYLELVDEQVEMSWTFRSANVPSWHQGRFPRWGVVNLSKKESRVPLWFMDLDRIEAEGLFYATVEVEGKPEVGLNFGEGNTAEDMLDSGRRTKFVGGLSYRGKKTEVEAVVRRFKEGLFAAWPEAKSELSSEQGVEIESITAGSLLAMDAAGWMWTPSMHIAFRDNWVFLATDRGLLAGTLARYARQAGAGKSLADLPSFIECRQHALPGADLCLWAGRFGEGVFAQPERNMAGRATWDGGVRALQYECGADEAMGGRLYFQTGRAPGTGRRGAAGAQGDGDRQWQDFVRAEAARGEEEFQEGNLLLGYRLNKTVSLEMELLAGREFPIAFLEWARRALPNFTIAVQPSEVAQGMLIGEASIAEYRRAVLDEEVGLWDWLPIGRKDDMELGQVLASGRLSTLELDLEPSGPSRRTPRPRPDFAAITAGPDGKFYYVALPAHLKIGAAEEPGFCYEWWLQPALGKRAAFTPGTPAALRVRRDGEGWVVESDLNVLGLGLTTKVLRGGI